MSPAADSLVSRYSGVVCDLDGVVYRGPAAVPGSVEALGALPVPVVYATNNASRPPSAVVEHLRSLGIELDDADVVTSAQAGADHLAQVLPEGAAVMAVGGDGVREALEARGFGVVSPRERGEGAEVAAVLQGYGPRLTAADLAETAYAVAAGVPWVATNTDLTLPTDRGTAPGNGTLIGAVRIATGVDPVVVGKPEPPLYHLCAARVGVPTASMLAVGDRLDTDIAGAVSAGMDSALVLTGVDSAATVAGAPANMRPRFVVADLASLLEPYAEPEPDGGSWRCGTVGVRLDGEHLLWTGDPHGLAGTRAGLAAIHEAVDAGRLSPERAVVVARGIW